MEKCFVCDQKYKKSTQLKARNGYFYLICSNCGAGKLMPRNRALKELKKAYQSEYFDWEEASGIRKYLNRIQLFKAYPEWINKFFPKRKGKLLDVGAGVPDFVLKMRNLGWDSFALEISKEQVKLIKKYINKPNVWQGDFESYRIKENTFEVITFWHMLEHLVYPAKAIAKSARVLKNGGMLFAEFPNLDSCNLKIFKENYCYFDLPGHLVYYNKESLKVLFKNNGFKIVEISYPLKLNGSFAINISNEVFKQTQNNLTKRLAFYILLPLSLIISVVFTWSGQTDLIRIAARKA